MIDIEILPEFSDKITDYTLVQIEADVTNGPTPQELSQELASVADSIGKLMVISDINLRPNIRATRQAYKTLGKDPNRYRPAQERLYRRIINGQGLYSVDALVDGGNLLSLITGCAVGVFDRDKIAPGTVTLGVGKEGEPYHGIGRGAFNIAGMPVLRDSLGGFGTPSSDDERTAISPSTSRILITVHCFTPEMSAEEIVCHATHIFTRFADAKNIQHKIHRL